MANNQNNQGGQSTQKPAQPATKPMWGEKPINSGQNALQERGQNSENLIKKPSGR
jgi:hypothetical protein